MFRKGISGLRLVGIHPDTKGVAINSYQYPPQEIGRDKSKELDEPMNGKIGSIHDYSLEQRIIHVKKPLKGDSFSF